ncbi:MAG: hypothetical protein EPO07_10605 [Verrucomicrobia bacterium]|nr:MAG: hypothetical protein EPO07_10605 [Verrucomicrobiota bacterium]
MGDGVSDIPLNLSALSVTGSSANARQAAAASARMLKRVIQRADLARRSIAETLVCAGFMPPVEQRPYRAPARSRAGNRGAFPALAQALCPYLAQIVPKGYGTSRLGVSNVTTLGWKELN